MSTSFFRPVGLSRPTTNAESAFWGRFDRWAGVRYLTIGALHGLTLFSLAGQRPLVPGSAEVLAVEWLDQPAPVATPAMPPAVAVARPVQRQVTATEAAPTVKEIAPSEVPPVVAATEPATASAAVKEVPVAAVAAPAIQAITPPRYDADYLQNPAPVYPPLARRLGEQGKVVLRVEVSADGRALTIEVHRSSGSPRLDVAATEAVRHWRFTPARQGDSPLAGWVKIPINFHLDD